MKYIYVVVCNSDDCECETIFCQTRWPDENQIVELCMTHDMEDFIDVHIDQYAIVDNDEFDTKKLKNIKDMFEDYEIDMDDIYSYLQLIGCDTVDEKDLKFNFDL